jgi:uncharacterized repeat protein (TIGR03803 family)
LARDAKGVLYGVTRYGGTYNVGGVFRLTPPAAGSGLWSESTLHSFGSDGDGAQPDSSLTFDGSGNLYGTTGPPEVIAVGAVYELQAPTSGGAWTERVVAYVGTDEYLSGPIAMNAQGDVFWENSGESELQEQSPVARSVVYAFTGGKFDQPEPFGGLTFDSSGSLYGTTQYGGFNGFGTVFQVSPSGIKWTESTLFQFDKSSKLRLPESGVIFGPDGALYGTALVSAVPDYGGGVFRLAPPASPGGVWSESTILTLTNSVGISPSGGVAFDTKGNIYVASGGGGLITSNYPYGCGTIFKLIAPTQPGGAWTPGWVYSFTCGADGANPVGTLVIRQDGTIYGVTSGVTIDGTNVGYGTVFQIEQLAN